MQKFWDLFLFYSTHRSQFKWIKDLLVNIGPEVVKVLEESIGEKLHDIGLGSNFMNITSKVQATKAKVGMKDNIKP